MTTTLERPAVAETAKIADLVCLVNVRFGTFPNTKKVPSDTVAVKKRADQPDTDVTMLGLNKKLLRCPELDAIKALVHRVRDYLDARELPTKGQFRSGLWFMSVASLEKVDAYMAQSKIDLADLVEVLIDAYEDRKAKSREELGTLYNEADYLTPLAIRERVTMSYEYQTLATPEGLKKLRPEIYEREKAKLEAQLQEAVEDSRQIIAQEAKNLIASIAERLTPDESGKTRAKAIRADMLDNWQAALDLLGSKNVASDESLAFAIEAAKAKLAGRSTDELRGNDDVRAEIRDAFAGLTEQLDEQVIDKPMRRMRLD